ncbi:MAG: DUF5024 domain-containing protein [Tannerella sp.]|jgi:hypothetical protein|nr:DUF5024 domain-containing protein [Tannerella sp.]
MKVKKIIVTGFLLIAGGFSMSVSAQENIKALIEKCKSMEANRLEVNVVRKKNKETKKIEREFVQISFEYNPALVKEFIVAFNKDKSAAIEEIERTKNGLKSRIYHFDNIICSFSQNKKGGASVSMQTE